MAKWEQESHKITVIRYLAWLRRQSQLATVESAREFVREVEGEGILDEESIERLREGIRWFFRNGSRRKQRQSEWYESSRQEECDDERLVAVDL